MDDRFMDFQQINSGQFMSMQQQQQQQQYVGSMGTHANAGLMNVQHQAGAMHHAPHMNQSAAMAQGTFQVQMGFNMGATAGMTFPASGTMPPPPAYTPQMAQSFQSRSRNVSGGSGSQKAVLSAESARKREQAIRVERQYKEQQRRLQRFKQAGSAVSLNADSLIDSMLTSSTSTPGASKSNRQVMPVTAQINNDNEEEDVFGDFLQGSTKSATTENVVSTPHGSLQMTNGIMGNDDPSTQISDSPSSIPASQIVEQTENKIDLNSLMEECTDLSHPIKSRTRKPSLRQVPVKHTTDQATFKQSSSARKWDGYTEDLSGVFVHNDSLGPQSVTAQSVNMPVKLDAVPAWCKSEDLLPPIYSLVKEAVVVDGQVSTSHLYPILMLSGLSRENLGYIWSLVNRSMPGQLMMEEMYMALALIALIQGNANVTSIDILHQCPRPPVPVLQIPGQQQQLGQPLAEQEHDIQHQAHTQHHASNGTGQLGHSMTSSEENRSFSPTITHAASAPAMLPTADKDDFADFQTAPADHHNNRPTPVVKPFKVIPAEPAKLPMETSSYVYSTQSLQSREPHLSFEERHSNVSTFFCSDESSSESTTEKSPRVHFSLPANTSISGATGNSLDDDDFEDFRSAGSHPSTSEQSENEDFRTFDSYVGSLHDSEQSSEQASPEARHKQHRTEAVTKPGKHPPGTCKHLSQASQPTDSQAIISNLTAVARILAQPDDGKSSQVAHNVTQSPSVKPLQLPHAVAQPPKESGGTLTQVHQAIRQVSGINSSHTTINNTSIPNVTDDDDFADFQSATEPSKSFPTINPHSESKSAADRYSALREMGTSDDLIETSVFSEQLSPIYKTFQETEKNSSGNIVSNSQPFVSSQNAIEEGWADFQSRGPVVSQPDSDDWADFQGPTPPSHINNSDMITGVSVDNVIAPAVTQVSNLFTKLDNQTVPSHVETIASNLGNLKTNSHIPTHNDLFSGNKVHSSHVEQNLHKRKSVESQISAESSISDHDPTRGVPPPMDDIPDDFHDDDDFGDLRSGISDLDPFEFKAAPATTTAIVFGNFSFTSTNSFNTGNGRTVNSTNTQQASDGSHGGLDKSIVHSANNINSQSASVMTTRVIDALENFDGLNLAMTGPKEDTQSISSLELGYINVRGHVHHLGDGTPDTQSVSSTENSGVDSVKGTTPNTMDSKSVDSLDLRDVDALPHGSSDIMAMPESLSVESFEFKSDNLSEGNTRAGSGDDDNRDCNFKQTELSSLSHQQPISASFLLSQSQMPVLGDRYASLMDDVSDSDAHIRHWERCVDTCLTVLNDANSIFNSISSSTVCHEVVKSSQGSDYLTGLMEVYRVARRISVAMNNAAITSSQLESLVKDTELCWTNLTAFIASTNAMPNMHSADYSRAILKADNAASQLKACGVCLLNVDGIDKTEGRIGENNEQMKLTYGGRQYHVTCANFWVNCVDPMLPALKLPELI